MLARILVPAATFFLGLMVKEVWERITRTKKPRFSRESARDARRAVNFANSIFNQAAQKGGCLSHPWEIRGEPCREDELQEEISASKAEIGDKKLSMALDVISRQIREMFATAYRLSPRVLSIDLDSPTGGDLYTHEESESRKKLQANSVKHLMLALKRSQLLSPGWTSYLEISSPDDSFELFFESITGLFPKICSFQNCGG